MGAWIVIAIAAAAILLSPPPRGESVVLLPQPDGKPSAVSVRAADGAELLLERPYAVANVSDKGGLSAAETSAAEVQARYGQTLEALPPRPASFIVHFVLGKTELTPDSIPVLGQVKAELAKRPVPEISLIGHTDRGGNSDANDRLARERAEKVKALLAADGVSTNLTEVVGRGEREPLAVGNDQAAAAINRRVEINIR